MPPETEFVSSAPDATSELDRSDKRMSSIGSKAYSPPRTLQPAGSFPSLNCRQHRRLQAPNQGENDARSTAASEVRIAKGGADVGDLATHIAESLVDLILLVPESEQAKLLAHTVSALGDLFLQKSGAEDGGSGSTH
jgi:hypothetical protein